MPVITVERKILKRNDEIAAENRTVFKQHNVFCLNLLSSPGSGKTSLLEQTLARLKDDLNVAVIEGDVQTDNDARRIAKYNIPVVQIVTNGGCHLEAKLVQDALVNFKLSGLDILFIENVGNLVCPANYDLGERKKVVIVSTTEGDDKPSKYPAMFRVAEVMVINKTDLLPYVDFSMDRVRQNALQINPQLQIFETSCKTGSGLENWIAWIRSHLKPSQ
jgi:hydrogenase nickel incorporation protein HypB